MEKNGDKTEASAGHQHDILAKSNLSVDAVEWYPPGYSSGAKQPPAANNHNHENEDDVLLRDLRLAIERLTVAPADYDAYSGEILFSLDKHLDNERMMLKVTEIIVQQAVKEQNFRYTGARICTLLNAHCPKFRSILHSHCEDELSKDSKVRELTLFLAELFSQLSNETFGKCLVKAIKSLLSTKGPDDVKCVCQTLKLTGNQLEKSDHSAMNDIISQLQALSGSVPKNLSGLLQSVLELRKSNWGQNEDPTPAPTTEQCTWSDGPVFYGPDGVELSMEESDFLAQNLDEIGPDDDPDALWDPEPEMDEEVRVAFQKFVQLNKQ